MQRVLCRCLLNEYMSETLDPALFWRSTRRNCKSMIWLWHPKGNRHIHWRIWGHCGHACFLYAQCSHSSFPLHIEMISSSASGLDILNPLFLSLNKLRRVLILFDFSSSNKLSRSGPMIIRQFSDIYFLGPSHRSRVRFT